VAEPSGCTSIVAFSFGGPDSSSAAGDLDVAGDPDAELDHVTAGPAFGLLLAQLVVAGRLQCFLQRRREVAAVVEGAEAVAVRLGERREQVAPAHLCRVHPDLGREQVHRPFDRGGRLRSARAAVRADRRRVGHHRAGDRLDLGEVVRARRHQPGQRRQERAQPGVGAGVLQHLEPVREDPAVVTAADRHGLHLGPAVGHPEQVLVPGLAPARRPADGPGDPGDERVLGVGAELRPERAADVRGDHPHPVPLEAEHLRQPGPGALGALVGDPGGEPAVLAPHRGGRPALHRRRRHPLVVDRAGDHDLAVVEQVLVELLAVADHGVGAGRGEDQRLVPGRLPRVDHRRQRVIVDADQLQHVLALVRVLDDDHRDRLADVPDRVRGEQGLGHAGGVAGQRRDRVDVGQVGRGEHGDDAGRGPGRVEVDAGDPGVRHRGADEEDVRRAGEPVVHQVLGVLAARGEELRIFGPEHAGPEDAHTFLPPMSAARHPEAPPVITMPSPAARGADGDRPGTAGRQGRYPNPTEEEPCAAGTWPAASPPSPRSP
jgi:hypothetical protein